MADPMPERRFEPPADSRPHDLAWPQDQWPPAGGSELAGRWVRLRQARVDDAPALYAALDHDAVWAHVRGRPRTPDELAAWIDARRADPTWFPWVLVLERALGALPAGSVVGTSAYLEASPVDARCEIGSTLYTPAVWGGPVNPEAKLLLLALAFDVLGMGRVQLKTDARNTRSQQAIARLGATYEGVLRRYQRREDGTVRDTVLFSITAEEWPAVRAGLAERMAAHEPG